MNFSEEVEFLSKFKIVPVWLIGALKPPFLAIQQNLDIRLQQFNCATVCSANLEYLLGFIDETNYAERCFEIADLLPHRNNAVLLADFISFIKKYSSERNIKVEIYSVRDIGVEKIITSLVRENKIGVVLYDFKNKKLAHAETIQIKNKMFEMNGMVVPDETACKRIFSSEENTVIFFKK